MPARKPMPVPCHSLGLSQIVAYGLLFYIFAQLKTPLAEAAGVTEAAILAAVTGALVLQSLLAPVVGGWVDRFGALPVMAAGLGIGAAGLLLLPVMASIGWIWLCMLPVGAALSMSTYEVAFGAAVQMDEAASRRNITYITFYGGVASTVTWLSVGPMLAVFGLQATCTAVAAVMLAMSARFIALARRVVAAHPAGQAPAPFSWRGLNGVERRAIVILAAASALEYLVFAATSLMWINWFTLQFSPAAAVLLASVYGPFQVAGRLLEMLAARRFDARWTALAAFAVAALAIVLARTDQLPVAVLSMVLFGMGHGVLTITFGYVTNMYFPAGVYGRAKGWISAPRGLGMAVGPSVGGGLFLLDADIFFAAMVAASVCGALVFACLLRLEPGNPALGAGGPGGGPVRRAGNRTGNRAGNRR